MSFFGSQGEELQRMIALKQHLLALPGGLVPQPDRLPRIWKINFLVPLLEPAFYIVAFGLGFRGLIGRISPTPARSPTPSSSLRP
jgi:hypothetical protein